jgi:hypothetical protein
MLQQRRAFSGFSVDDIYKAKEFHDRIRRLEAKILAASLQIVRKISGFNKPSRPATTPIMGEYFRSSSRMWICQDYNVSGLPQ